MGLFGFGKKKKDPAAKQGQRGAKLSQPENLSTKEPEQGFGVNPSQLQNMSAEELEQAREAQRKFFSEKFAPDERCTYAWIKSFPAEDYARVREEQRGHILGKAMSDREWWCD